MTLRYKKTWAEFCPEDLDEIHLEPCPFCGNIELLRLDCSKDGGWNRSVQLSIHCNCRIRTFYSVIRDVSWSYYNNITSKYESGSQDPLKVILGAKRDLMRDWNERYYNQEAPASPKAWGNLVQGLMGNAGVGVTRIP